MQAQAQASQEDHAMADNSDEDSNFLTLSSGEELTSESGSDQAEGVIPNEIPHYPCCNLFLTYLLFADC
jgi:hypothetical protein